MNNLTKGLIALLTITILNSYTSFPKKTNRNNEIPKKVSYIPPDYSLDEVQESFADFFYKDNLKIDFLDDIYFDDMRKWEALKQQLQDKYKNKTLSKKDLREIALPVYEAFKD